jgi:isoamylase/glycogen operon protein
MLDRDGRYRNFSGCGNTFDCNHPVVREFIRDSLRFWAAECHVDGFRFDLASILTRGQDGETLRSPPLIEAIAQDPILANTKLIAEAWDAGGLYQVGSFPSFGRWGEWNGKYRDDIRQFIKGTDGSSGNFATRISGSEDLYGKERHPSHSINFVTCHDGFSLADLVAYNIKHNEMNGENNADGENNNISWNCGVEGETNDPNILALRERQRKNFHVALMVSQGIPMLLMGDEYGHTKLGNNNAWAHDSRLNWFQWDTLNKNQSFYRFYRMMIELRKSHPILTRSRFLGPQDIAWHGIDPDRIDWGVKNRFIACTLPDQLNHYVLYIAFNAFHEEIEVSLPESKKPWR